MISIEGQDGIEAVTPEQRPVDVGGCWLQARVWQPREPRGVPYVLLHGIGANARTWDGVAARLAAAGHLTCAVDFRGHGLSDAPKDGYDMLSFAEDLVGAVDGLELALPVAVGHSLGAYVAMETASRDPDLLRGIVLVEGGVIALKRQFETPEEMIAQTKLPNVAGMPMAALRAGLLRMHPDYQAWQIEAMLASFREGPDGTAEWRLTPERFEVLQRGMYEQRTVGFWKDLLVPALMILSDTGDAAWTAEKRAGLETVYEVSQQLRHEWIGHDHETHMTNAEAVARSILASTDDGFLMSGMRYR